MPTDENKLPKIVQESRECLTDEKSSSLLLLLLPRPISRPWYSNGFRYRRKEIIFSPTNRKRFCPFEIQNAYTPTKSLSSPQFANKTALWNSNAYTPTKTLLCTNRKICPWNSNVYRRKIFPPLNCKIFPLKFERLYTDGRLSPEYPKIFPWNPNTSTADEISSS